MSNGTVNEATAHSAMTNAPTTAAAVPCGLTAPDVPGSTCRQVRMDRGAALSAMPSSVAQVSAVAAASAPNPNNPACHEPENAQTTAAIANSAPFASTCQASRERVSGSTDLDRRRLSPARHRVNSTEL